MKYTSRFFLQFSVNAQNNHFNHMRTKVLATSDHDIFVLTGYTVSPARWDTYFLVNRVENQKLNQTTAELPFG